MLKHLATMQADKLMKTVTDAYNRYTNIQHCRIRRRRSLFVYRPWRTGKENPFYFALPYNDLTKFGYKENVEVIIPWAKEAKEYGWEWPYSYCKNRWIRIIYKGRFCYAQWEDVGPFETDDRHYVFGSMRPKNMVNSSVGLDISPACYNYLGIIDNDYTNWQFLEFEDVPDGPWKKVITTSLSSWN